MPAVKEPVPDEKVFDNFFGRLAKRIDPYHEADPIGIMMSFAASCAGLLGTAITGGPRVAARVGSQPATVWPLLIGTSGTGFKGQSTKAAMEIMNLAFEGFDDAFVKAGFDTGLAVIEEMHLRVNQDTKRRLPLIVTEEEMVKITKIIKGDSKLGPAFTKMFDGSPVTYASGNGKFYIKDPWVCWLGHIQPRHYKDTKGTAAMDTGVWNRFLPLWVTQSKRLPVYLDIEDLPPYEKVQEEIAAALVKAIPVAMGKKAIKPSKAVAIEFERHHRPIIDRLKNQSEEVADYAQRIQAYVSRFAALYALFDGCETVRTKDFDSALALVTYAVDTIKWVLNGSRKGSGRTTLARNVLSHVIKYGPCTYSHTRKHCGGTIDKNGYIAAFVELQDEIVVYTMEPKGRGHQNAWYLAEIGDDRIPDDAEILNFEEIDSTEVDPDDESGHPNWRVTKVTVNATDDDGQAQADEDDGTVDAVIVEDSSPPLQRLRAIAPPEPPKPARKGVRASTGAPKSHRPARKEESQPLAAASSGTSKPLPEAIDAAGWF